MWERLDDFVLVSDDALKAATRVMIEKTRNLVEPAGAAALAAVLGAPERFAGRKVAVVCSGGNIKRDLLPGGRHRPGQAGAQLAPAGARRSARADRDVSQARAVMMLARWNSPPRSTSRGDWPKPAVARAKAASVVTAVPAL